MAHPLIRRDLQPLALWRHFPARPCVLCGLRSCAGALCPLCRETLRLSAQRMRCPRCALALPPLGLLSCPDCAAGQVALQAAVAAFDYEHPGDMLVHGLKILHQLELVPVLADLMVAQWQVHGPGLDKHAWIIPVPARRRALRERGFSPSALLAHQVARRLFVRMCPVVVRWNREGAGVQKRLGRRARRAAMRDAFVLSARLDGRDVLLVDDVLTTGATLDALARTCRLAGARSVCALVAARAPWRPVSSLSF
ncbi:ComF family protein [Alcaligenes sp. SDU_A2]|uniref:ComF family protein n=1 Tax=Alcaligenes sp. SDU_A2 TaxID=3136634 RepID=UPI00311E46A8